MRYANPDNGLKADQMLAAGYLELGGIYVVEDVEVHSYNTLIELAWLPGVAFNSVLFDNVGEAESVPDSAR